MSNKTILEKLLVEIEAYDKNSEDRDSFAIRLADSIEALESIPYSIVQESRGWCYKLETEGYFDEEGCESELEKVIPELKVWIQRLLEAHS
jgi:hypothetical protein